MATLGNPLFQQPLCADDVCRGVARLFHHMGSASIMEFPLGNGRRADIAALDNKGRLVIVEVKVSMADLRGDVKWPEYLHYCDLFYFAVPQGFDLSPFDEEAFGPGRNGLIVADRFEAVVLREPEHRPLPGARRRSETLRFARKAALRLQGMRDPEFQYG